MFGVDRTATAGAVLGVAILLAGTRILRRHPPAVPKPSGRSSRATLMSEPSVALARRTPPSSILLPNEKKLHALAVPGTRTAVAGDKHIRLVELRGWLRAVDSTCYRKDPAWYYLLEPDLAWSDAAGLRLSDILWVGNVAALGDQRQGAPPWQIESRPLIRIEFGGWDETKRRSSPPDDWRSRGLAGCSEVFFAFDPLRPDPAGPRLVPGRYIRVVGAFASDDPHSTKAAAGVWLVRNFGLAVDPVHVIHAAENAWSEGEEENRNNPARWTEIHPPDEIEPLPARKPTETVRGVAVRIPDGAFSQPAKPMEISLAPPGPRPAWAQGIRVMETILDVSLESAFERSVAACRLAAAGDRVRIRIDLGSVRADKFAAIFRVSWSSEGDSWLVVRPQVVRRPEKIRKASVDRLPA
jgi:hypothetical protein